jgi:hypothetical protein
VEEEGRIPSEETRKQEERQPWADEQLTKLLLVEEQLEEVDLFRWQQLQAAQKSLDRNPEMEMVEVVAAAAAVALVVGVVGVAEVRVLALGFPLAAEP